MCKVYGYTRISTAKQSMERQERNILAAYPDAAVMREVFTGTKAEGREVFARLMKQVKAGDTIVFDSVSRMSRNAQEGFSLYQDFYGKGIELVFLKEPQINTATYKQAMDRQIAAWRTDGRQGNGRIDPGDYGGDQPLYPSSGAAADTACFRSGGKGGTRPETTDEGRH